ncbi:hypothetical protein VOLCADRAFT_105512 [Volvox carteri f. nagariensis]|uniref:Uncharacterized protein n=1 Tax=Volvox carteri f. nagariensis TaxID=3068 RepID=D8U1B9_VOLCA|nr:uncharacterized protein VOLCADRAFT_105512 [Volvox carteri f. nagariensis]EFJ46530.1 hypothetical protein VOLCADRAFT_105512 [Volvox carteri f. nagariensis]|eukprot:XP_002952387.1 hypothetical protein VOLCADRAFT_105512 [Volvox carteri f. nagariensis]
MVVHPGRMSKDITSLTVALQLSLSSPSHKCVRSYFANKSLATFSSSQTYLGTLQSNTIRALETRAAASQGPPYLSSLSHKCVRSYFAKAPLGHGEAGIQQVWVSLLMQLQEPPLQDIRPEWMLQPWVSDVGGGDCNSHDGSKGRLKVQTFSA